MIATRDFVLYLLKKAGDFVSGEEISEQIGVSRAAVNAAVKSLRNDGYQIESVTNKGYRLKGCPPGMLNIGELLPFLDLSRALHVTVLDCVDSTNNYLKQLCSEGKAHPGDCVIANQQTSGRGRAGRQFASPKGTGIYLSYVLDGQSASAKELSEITAWVAVAMQEAIEEACRISCDIKWVNDLVMQTRKIGGILTEMSLEAESHRIQYVITGIGINVNQTEEDFPEALKDMAVSLRMISGNPLNRAALCAAMIKKLDKLCKDFPKERQSYLEKYRKHCAILGKELLFSSGEEEIRAHGLAIDEHFGLVIRKEDGSTDTITGGEAHVRGFYGST